MTGNFHHLLMHRVLVIVSSIWLPVSTMAVPPCCCSLQLVAPGLVGGLCCCSADNSLNLASPSESPCHPQRPCGCSAESITATLPDAVSVGNATQVISDWFQLQATLLAHDSRVLFAVKSQDLRLGRTRPRSAVETCVALSRFLC